MSKVWFVVYLFGKSAAVIGPLPYDYPECEARRVVQEEQIRSIFSHQGKMTVDELTIKPTDVRLACEIHTKRPELDVDTAIDLN